MKHRGSFPHRMDAPDRHNGQRDNRTNGRTNRRRDVSLRPSASSFRPSLRWSLTLYPRILLADRWFAAVIVRRCLCVPGVFTTLLLLLIITSIIIVYCVYEFDNI